jgi:hypothetical protein
MNYLGSCFTNSKGNSWKQPNIIWVYRISCGIPEADNQKIPFRMQHTLSSPTSIRHLVCWWLSLRDDIGASCRTQRLVQRMYASHIDCQFSSERISVACLLLWILWAADAGTPKAIRKKRPTSFGFAEYPLEFLQQTIRNVLSKPPAKSITSRQPNELRCSVVCTTAKSQVMRSNSFSIVQLFCQNICVMSVSQVKRSNFYQFLAIQPTVPDSNRHFFMGENAHSCILKLRVVDYMPGLVVSVHKSLRQAQRFP